MPTEACEPFSLFRSASSHSDVGVRAAVGEHWPSQPQAVVTVDSVFGELSRAVRKPPPPPGHSIVR